MQIEISWGNLNILLISRKLHISLLSSGQLVFFFNYLHISFPLDFSHSLVLLMFDTYNVLVYIQPKLTMMSTIGALTLGS